MPIEQLVYPDINGVRYSFASVEILIDGVVFTGVESITYKSSLTPVKVYGTATEAIGRTRGKGDHEASITLYKSEARNLTLALSALAGGIDGYKEIPFDVFVTYFENGQIPILDALIGCRIEDDDENHSAGSADPLKVALKLNVMRVKRSGSSQTLPFPTI